MSLKRRQIYKPVLDNPYTQSTTWPFVSPETSSQILDHLSSILSGLGTYNKLVKEAKEKDQKPMKEPEIRSKITVGFNSTVKALEIQASVHKKQNKGSALSKRFIKYVFVAKFDIQPEILLQAFPVLCFTASPSQERRVKLVQLPKSSMSRLSKMLNVDNLGILGMDEDLAEAEALYRLVDREVNDVQVPWLNGLFDGPEVFLGPAIKFLKTSAPMGKQKEKHSNVESNQHANEGNKDKEHMGKTGSVKKKQKHIDEKGARGKTVT